MVLKINILFWSNVERFKILDCLWDRNSGSCIALIISRAEAKHWSWIPWPVKLLLSACVCVFCRWFPSLFIVAVPNISQKYLHKSLCYVSGLEFWPMLHIWRIETQYLEWLSFALYWQSPSWIKCSVQTEIEWAIKTEIIHLGSMFRASPTP